MTAIATLNGTMTGQMGLLLDFPSTSPGTEEANGRSVSEQAAFDYAQSKGAELPDDYVSPYGVEERVTASMRSITRSDYETGSAPVKGQPLPKVSFRVLCEDERPMSGWFVREEAARKFAEGYNIRHFKTIGNSANPKNPLRI